MSTYNEKLIADQTNQIEAIDVAKELDKFLTRTLFLEKIRKQQEDEYNKSVKALEEEKEKLSTLEKWKTRKEFEEKMEQLRREKFKLEILTYENVLKDQIGKIDNKSSFSKGITNNLKQQAYTEDFNELLKSSFPQVHKELTSELKALKDGQNLTSRQAMFHLLEVTTGKKSLSQELDKLYQEDSIKKIKSQALTNGLKALKITGLVVNPAGFIIREIASKVSEIPVMKKVLNTLNERFDDALDVLGVSEQNKKYIKIAGGLVVGALVVGTTGALLLPHETLNADELLGGLDSIKDKATNALSNIDASEKMEQFKQTVFSSNVGENVDMVKEGTVIEGIKENQVSNVIEQQKTAFTEGLKGITGTQLNAEQASFKPTDLIVNNQELKLPEVYDDTKAPVNLVIDPERAEALHQTRLTGEVADILTQNTAAEILTEPKVATSDKILSALEGKENSNSTIDNVAVDNEIIKERVVKEGEHFRQIVDDLDSEEFDLKGSKLTAVVNLIAEQNNISDPNKLSIGQVINMPHDTESLKEFCELHKDRLSELMKQDFNEPSVNSNVELPSHTAPVSASPNGFTQLAPEIEMPIQSEVIVPREMLVQNSRLIASNILENIPKDQLESLMSNARTDEKQLLDILSANVEKQIMQDPAGQFEANKIVIEFNQDREALEKQYGRTISDSMIRRMGETLVVEPSVIMNAYTSVESELKSTIAPSVNYAANPTIELPKETVLSNGMQTPQGKLEITTEKIDGRDVVVHRHKM